MAEELSITEYAVLGLLTFGERSGYELDALAKQTIGFFWRPAKSSSTSCCRGWSTADSPPPRRSRRRSVPTRPSIGSLREESTSYAQEPRLRGRCMTGRGEP
jgi:hypothetical protein